MVEGYSVAVITCRGCGRRKDMPPENVPARSHDRLRCKACWHLGADISIVWTAQSPPNNVVRLMKKKGRPE